MNPLPISGNTLLHNTLNNQLLPPEINWDKWVPTEETSLLFALRDTNILLIHKKRGLGAGKINAPGGRVEKGESFQDAAIREAREEVGIEAADLHYSGILSFEFTNGYSTRCHVFKTELFEGTPIETDEATPVWFDIKDIPYNRMWADDILWIPMMLNNIPFDAHFIFDDDIMLWHDLPEEDSRSK